MPGKSAIAAGGRPKETTPPVDDGERGLTEGGGNLTPFQSFILGSTKSTSVSKKDHIGSPFNPTLTPATIPALTLKEAEALLVRVIWIPDFLPLLEPASLAYPGIGSPVIAWKPAMAERT